MHFIFIYLFIYFWPRHAASRMLVPRPGIEPGALAVKALSPNRWTAREYPVVHFKALSLPVLKLTFV